MPFWRAAKVPSDKPQVAPSIKEANNVLVPGARWNVFNRNAYHRRREFNPGAPAFAYANQGVQEFPIAAGFNNRYQFLVWQKPIDISPDAKMGLPLFGQSWAMPSGSIGQQLYTPAQITTLAKVAADSGYLPPASLRDPGIWGAPG